MRHHETWIYALHHCDYNHREVSSHSSHWLHFNFLGTFFLFPLKCVLDQGFPTCGTPRGTFEISNRRENIFRYELFPNINTKLCDNEFTMRHKNGVYLYSSKNLKVLLRIQWILLFYSAFCHKKFSWCMLTCRNAEVVHGQRKVGNHCARPVAPKVNYPQE